MRLTAAIAIAAVAILGALGCGDDESDETQTAVQVETPTQPAAPTEAPTTPAAPVEDGKAKAKPTAEAKAAEPAKPACPKGMSEGECQEAARAIDALGPSRPAKPGKCPSEWTKQECKEFAKAVAALKPGREVKNPTSCEPPLSQADCEAAAKLSQ